ncbi:GNAT family N-acetyltransferase [Kitasatospora sp. NPDC057542]|uniref:GNAT family N-acetyltransferase n=1 Tax=Kitasatospora sp. NPDC057542 TaxID=3346162 RepID=UPI0036D10487
MTIHALTITQAAPDDPRVLQLVRDLDADLTARYPDEPGTGGAHLHPDIRFLLAEADGRPVGCCAIQPFPDGAAELTRLYVTPDARGHGIATRLLAEAERTAAALGHPEIRLEAGVHQPEAIALYTRAGYTPIPNNPPYQDSSSTAATPSRSRARRTTAVPRNPHTLRRAPQASTWPLPAPRPKQAWPPAAVQPERCCTRRWAGCRSSSGGSG